MRAKDYLYLEINWFMNIKLKINLPSGHYREKLCGVYKITFDNGCFYIGASGHLRQRARDWRSVLAGWRGKQVRNNIFDKTNQCAVAEFDVVKYVPYEDLRLWEERTLNENNGNPFLVNRFLYVKIPVIQYTKDMVFIMRHDSIMDASKFIKGRHAGVRDVVSGRKKGYRGFIFKTEIPDAVNPHVKKSNQTKYCNTRKKGISFAAIKHTQMPQ